MAIVQINENTLDFILDNNVSFFEAVSEITLLNFTKLYIIDTQNTYILLDSQKFEVSFTCAPYGNVDACQFDIGGYPCIKLKTASSLFASIPANKWVYLPTMNSNIPIKGFRVEGYTLAEGQTLETLNELLNPYIGDQTHLIKQIYSITVNGKPLKFVNGKVVKRIQDKIFIYELVERPSDELPDDTTLVFTANTTDIYSVSWYNEDTTQEIQVYLNDELIGASSESTATIDFPYSLVDGEQYRLTFKGGKLNIGGYQWFISTSSEGAKTRKQSTIKEIIWGKNYGKYIYEAAFDSSKITELKLPSSIVEVADVYNGSSGITINAGVFSGCISLVEAVLNEGLTNIGSWMFNGCVALANITIPNTVLSLGEKCFQTTALANLTIPSSVKSVGTQALYAGAGYAITFKHTENDELTFATQIFNKPKNAVAMTIKHYGNPTVLNYDYATYNITPTFVDLREQQ